MKIRQGFVSNSSSTSFVVALPKGYRPSKEDVEYALKQAQIDGEYFNQFDDQPEIIAGKEFITKKRDDKYRISILREYNSLLEEGATKVSGTLLNLLKDRIVWTWDGPSDDSYIYTMGKEQIKNAKRALEGC